MTINQYDDPIALFRSSWSTYQKIVEHNYMFHQELFSACKPILRSLHKPIQILELGSGDASLIKSLLCDFQIKLYSGCDLSENALQLAKINLSNLDSTVELNCIDMLSQLKRLESNSFDVIFSSFAIHHLSDDDKNLLFGECYRVLKIPGFFILIDVIRNEDEGRQIYIEKYLNAVDTHWSALTKAEFEQISDHVRANDFPNTAKGYHQFAVHSGFASSQQLAAFTWHQAWAYKKSS
jgi:ubiquinone/menaquinone biosynthesis C-methylase UbiE